MLKFKENAPSTITLYLLMLLGICILLIPYILNAQVLKPATLEYLNHQDKVLLTYPVNELDTQYVYPAEKISRNVISPFTERLSSTTIKIYAGVPQFYKQNNEWFQLEYKVASTTDIKIVEPISKISRQYFELIKTARASSYGSNSTDSNGLTRQATWALARSTNTCLAYSSSNTDYWGVVGENDSGSYQIGMSNFFFNTSDIPDTDSIASSTFVVWAYYHPDYDADSISIGLVDGYSSSISASDCNKNGSMEFAERQTPPNDTTGHYEYFNLNATGLADISLTASTTLGLRASNDLDNSQPTGRNLIRIYYSENTGTSQDPFLLVESNPPPAPLIANYRIEDFTDELLLTYVYLLLFLGSIYLTYKIII